jgi:hypothetical protein
LLRLVDQLLFVIPFVLLMSCLLGCGDGALMGEAKEYTKGEG